jgi:hypothetical protein
MRIIPKNSKVKLTFYKGISVVDVLIAFVALVLIAITLSTNFPFKWMIALGELIFVIPFYLTVGGERIYQYLYFFVRYLFSRKKYWQNSAVKNAEISGLIPYQSTRKNLIINKDGTYTAVLKIEPMEFRMLSIEKQDRYIDGVLGKVINELSEVTLITLTKLETPLTLEGKLQDELNLMETLLRVKGRGELTEEECQRRIDCIQSRMEVIDDLNSNGNIFYATYYLTITDTSWNDIDIHASRALNSLIEGCIHARRLNDSELKKFLTNAQNPYVLDCNGHELDSGEPSEIRFGLTSMCADEFQISQFLIHEYPLRVGNGWGEGLFDMPNTKVVMRMVPIETPKAIHRIDNAIMELEEDKRSDKASAELDRSTHLESLQDLLADIQSDNETLFDTTVLITVYDRKGKNENRKKTKARLREMGFGYNELLGRQMDAYITSEFSQLDRIKSSRGIQTSSLAACFPFISGTINDPNGLLIGQNNLPVFLDFFKRDQEHVNSNLVVIGQSGMGKSYAVKTVLAGLASSGAKVFVLDPENEYGRLAVNLGGDAIDVSNGRKARINPFEITEGIEDGGGAFELHLLFLEQFFRLTLDGLGSDSFELMNRLVQECYQKKGIGKNVDLSQLSSCDYPTFSDLYELIQEKLQDEKDSYVSSCLKTLSNYVSKFQGEGRYSDIWNGPTSFNTSGNFAAFNFQRLLSSPNDKTANAQMLLVLKYLENEVIKNRERNRKNKTHQKIVVAIDEAHLFIDQKYPVALDFMFQLAKRIRKYDGMLMIVTQNIKDFAGTPEIERKASAIINVSQYSLIFSLSPNDMTELCRLYENAGEINEAEKEAILNNKRGSAFLISSVNERTNIDIYAPGDIADLFE